jgi:hypothetical protein
MSVMLKQRNQLLGTVALVLLTCASTSTQITNVKLDYDRIQVAENFLREIYPELKPDGLLVTFQTVLGRSGTSWSYVGVTRCIPGFSGVPVGDPPGCDGPMQSDTSSYLMAQVQLVYSKPHLYGFGAGGKFVDEKREILHQAIIEHPEWGEKDMLQALARMGPQYGPDDKEAFVKVIPSNVIERFSGCRLSPDSATLAVKRLSAPPDTDMRIEWIVSGTSDERHRPNCSATFEPFKGRLLTILK